MAAISQLDETPTPLQATKPRRTFLKVATLASSILLALGAIFFSTGVFNWMFNQGSSNEAVFMSGSKMRVLAPLSMGSETRPSPAFMSSSKSIVMPPMTPKASETLPAVSPEQSKPGQ